MADNAATLPQQPAAPIQPPPVIVAPPPAQGQAGAAQNVPAPAQRNRAPRRDGLPPSTATIAGIPALYQLVANLPFHTVNRKTISTFVPSFIAICTVIHQMNFTMAYTHRFQQSAPAWIPPVTFLYIGVLFIIQTLRAQREVGDVSQEELWLLEGFEKMYNLQSLMIPGPLIPFFQALAAASGPFENLGDFTPRLPRTWTCTAASGYYLNNSLGALLPNIALYMDAILKPLPTFNDSTDAAGPKANAAGYATKMKHFWNTVHSTTAAANSYASAGLHSPGAWSTISFTETQYANFSSFRDHFGFPPRLNMNSSGDITTLAQFLRFYPPGQSNTQFYPWFGNVSSLMQRYSQFFKESVPLSAIPPSATASGLPVWTMSHNPRLVTPFTFHHEVAATDTTIGYPAYYEVHHLNSVAAKASHPDPNLLEVEEQNSAVAMINIDLVTSSGLTAPTNAHIRAGPIWNLPEVRSSPEIDYVNSIGANLTQNYHVDTRQTS